MPRWGTSFSRFDFNKRVDYDDDAKKAFHREAKAALKALAKHLDLMETQYDLRVNKGGIAVSGEVTLHSDQLYLQVSQTACGGESTILYRRCEGRKDYHGGRNLFVPIKMLNNPAELAERIKPLFEQGEFHPGSRHSPVDAIRSSHHAS